MRNLFHMDLYRMLKSRTVIVCAALALFFGLIETPLAKLLEMVVRTFSSDPLPATLKEVLFSDILKSPFPMVNAMIAMISICSFFYSDHEGGYIKNIAGQMPKRGFTVLSKYLASIPHNLVFVILGILGNLLGTLPFVRVTAGNIPEGLLALGLKFLLMQSICSVLLLATGSFRAKSLGTVISVLMGAGLLGLFYSAIDMALHQIPFLKEFSIMPYMPDQLMGMAVPPTVRSLAVSAVVTAVFLPLAIRCFDRRDIK